MGFAAFAFRARVVYEWVANKCKILKEMRNADVSLWRMKNILFVAIYWFCEYVQTPLLKHFTPYLNGMYLYKKENNGNVTEASNCE